MNTVNEAASLMGRKSRKNLKKKLGTKQAFSDHFRELAKKRWEKKAVQK